MESNSLLAVVPAVTVALYICPRTPKAIVRKLLEKAEPFPTGGRNPLWPALWHCGSDHGRLVWVHLQATQVPTLLGCAGSSSAICSRTSGCLLTETTK